MNKLNGRNGVAKQINYLLECKYCHDTIDQKTDTYYRGGMAWIRHRRFKATGNTYALVDWSQDFACSLCIGNLKQGVSPDQMRLFHLVTDDD